MENNNINPPNPSPEEDEIDLIALAKTLWNGRKKVIKTTLIFMAIGLFVAIFTPKEFTASTMLLPQTNKSSKLSGSLGGLAAMAGIDLGSSGDESGISPLLYPEIVNSIPYQLELLQTPLNIKGQDAPVTYAKYYTDIASPGLLGYIKKFTIGLPGTILSAIKGKPTDVTLPARLGGSGVEGQILSITPEQQGLIKGLSGQISLEANKKDGYITLDVNMPEALAAAQLADKAQQLLQSYIIKFKIQKSTEQLKFIEDRYTEKQSVFKSAQQKLANFRDRNQNMGTAVAQSQLQSLQSEYDLAYGVYSELAKQLETQQIQVKEDTPVFTILKPVSIPMEKSKPNRPMILFIWTFLGGLVGVGMVFGRDYLGTIKEKWVNS